MLNQIGIPIDRIRWHMEILPRKNPWLPELVHAALGDVGGLWSGLARLRQQTPASSQGWAIANGRLSARDGGDESRIAPGQIFG